MVVHMVTPVFKGSDWHHKLETRAVFLSSYIRLFICRKVWVLLLMIAKEIINLVKYVPIKVPSIVQVINSQTHHQYSTNNTVKYNMIWSILKKFLFVFFKRHTANTDKHWWGWTVWGQWKRSSLFLTLPTGGFPCSEEWKCTCSF